ncbi:MAG: hypothetical protein ACRDJU_11960 [Actinomycetota bacterium]
MFRVGGSPRTWKQDVFAACAWLGSPPESWPKGATAVVSHRAAARLHGLNGFEEAAVEVTAGKRRQFPGSSFLAHYGMPDPGFVVLIDGIPVTNMARTLIDLAAVLPHDEHERVLDDALRQRKVDEKWLRYAVAHVTGSGRRGAKAMKALLDDWDPLDGPSASAFQKGLRRLVLGAGFPMVEEYGIPGLRYRGDLGSGDYGIIVEGDSKKHHSGRQDWDHDLHRRDEIGAAGYLMQHFTPDDLERRPEWILAKVEETFRARGWPGPSNWAPVPTSPAGGRSRTG